MTHDPEFRLHDGQATTILFDNNIAAHSAQMPRGKIANISAYKFFPMTNLKPLREHLTQLTKGWKLKGTILLTPEGINAFVAGAEDVIDKLIKELREIPGLADLSPKISFSDRQPFTRMLVKIKKEIITFGIEGIEPGRQTSRKISAQELKKWLDEGRELTLLDTRNDYEVKLGSFKGALPIGIDHFRDFPQAVGKLPAALKTTPIVMFCTGGIRCEKAGPFMEQEGFQNIFQLDGGILKYFEECGDRYYDGRCFVFDQRVALEANLQKSDDKLCFECLTPLTLEEQQDPKYQHGVSCPHCFKTPEESLNSTIERRHLDIRSVTTPLPGSLPYDNYRPINVPARLDGHSVLDFISGIFPEASREYWQQELASGRLLNPKQECAIPNHTVRSGEQYQHLTPANTEPDVAVNITVIYEDNAIIVINKPQPLPVHPSGRFNRNTLQYILAKAYYPIVPRPAHRLDANTSGLIVFTKTKHYASILQPQFARGEVEKTYRVKVQGVPAEDVFSCNFAISNHPTVLGARTITEDGLAALTHFNVIERFADQTSLLEARPITGRTNQIRIHLWQLGLPIVGDQVYLANQKYGITQTHTLNDARLHLHSHRLVFNHPLTQERVTFVADEASDFH